MKQFTLISASVLIFIANAVSYTIPENQKSFADTCITRILDCEYPEALRLADSAMSADMNDPLAPMLRLTAIGVRDVDLDTLLDSIGFLRAYETSIVRIAQYEKQHGVSSYSTMLRGFCKGLHASFYLRRESYVAAMQTGFDALKQLETAYRLDSTNSDALLFLGLYDYARGELKKKLWWVMFWYPGSKERGVRRLWICANGGQLTSTASLLALADIFVRDKKPAQGIIAVNRLEKESPSSRFVLWAKAKYLESCQRWADAADVYGLLAISYKTAPAGNFGRITTLNSQAHLLFRAGKKQDAAAVCRIILPAAGGKRNKLVYKDTEKLLRQADGSNN